MKDKPKVKPVSQVGCHLENTAVCIACFKKHNGKCLEVFDRSAVAKNTEKEKSST